MLDPVAGPEGGHRGHPQRRRPSRGSGLRRELAEWLVARLQERGWSNSELGRRAGISGAMVSYVVSGQQNAGVAFCRGVAAALDEPPERVFRLAGLLPAREEREELVEEILFFFDRMTPEGQEHFRRIARALAEGGERRVP
jgi:transcriptional regulator with XRE-family HTH domain